MIWNLIPADKLFNSSKNNKLPPFEKYFDKFFDIQSNAFEIIKSKVPNNRFLEDYLLIYPDLKGILSKKKLKETIQPLITIASNNGFLYMK